MTVEPKKSPWTSEDEFVITLDDAELRELRKLAGYGENVFVPAPRLLAELAADLIESDGGSRVDVGGNQLETMAHAGGVRASESPALIAKALIDRARTRAEDKKNNPLLTTARRMRGV